MDRFVLVVRLPLTGTVVAHSTYQHAHIAEQARSRFQRGGLCPPAEASILDLRPPDTRARVYPAERLPAMRLVQEPLVPTECAHPPCKEPATKFSRRELRCDRHAGPDAKPVTGTFRYVDLDGSTWRTPEVKK